jgi:hypothetical protein
MGESDPVESMANSEANRRVVLKAR